MTCGVYALYCSPLSQMYIGSSTSIEDRIDDHLSSLQALKHPNIVLQDAFSRHPNDFVPTILEEIPPNPNPSQWYELQYVREQEWIDSYDWDFLLNISSRTSFRADWPYEGRTISIDEFVPPYSIRDQAFLKSVSGFIWHWSGARKGLANESHVQDIHQEAVCKLLELGGSCTDKQFFLKILKPLCRSTAYKLKNHNHLPYDDFQWLYEKQQAFDYSKAFELVDVSIDTMNALTTMPKQQRRCWELNVQGYKSHEIGYLLDIAPSTARNNLLKARLFLKDKLLP